MPQPYISLRHPSPGAIPCQDKWQQMLTSENLSEWGKAWKAAQTQLPTAF